MIVFENKMWRTNYAGEKLEDISDMFIEGRVTADPENDQTWNLDAVIHYDGWKQLRPYQDWIVPEMTVTYPGMSPITGDLGLYFVLDSPEEHAETWGRVQLQTGDPLWLVARTGFVTKFKVPGGERKDRVVRQILDGVPLTDDIQGHRRFAIPDTEKTFRKAHEWPRTDNRLVVCNEINQGMGCYPLWTQKSGFMLTKRMGEARLRNRHPVRVFSANVPSNIRIEDRYLPWGGLPSNVVGMINTTPKGQDLLNEILIINDDPEFSKVNVRGRISDRKNPRAALERKGRRHSKKIRNKIVEEDATAREVAEALLDELSTRNLTIRIEVHPDPRTEYLRETVSCLIWNARGDEIANGQYAVHRVEYGLTPKSGTMVLDLGRIDDARDVVIG